MIKSIKDEAIIFVRQRENIRKIIKNFVIDNQAVPKEVPVTLFMAGSPGAGKTEFSKWFVKGLKTSIIRLDPDEIRSYIPGYNGTNSSEVHSAVCICVEKIYDFVLKNKYDILIDGTLASVEVARKNIKRSLKRNRKVGIFYLFQPPNDAWKFTQKRELLEGRKITKKVFINDFLNAYKNINLLKKEFGKNIEIYFIEKDFNHNIVKFKVNVDNLDKYINFKYTIKSLDDLLKDNLFTEI